MPRSAELPMRGQTERLNVVGRVAVRVSGRHDLLNVRRQIRVAAVDGAAERGAVHHVRKAAAVYLVTTEDQLTEGFPAVVDLIVEVRKAVVAASRTASSPPSAP